MYNQCRVCKSTNSFSIYEMANDKDNKLGSVYICTKCFVLYNPALDEQTGNVTEFENVQGQNVHDYYTDKNLEVGEIRTQVAMSHGILEFLFLQTEAGIRRRTFIDIGSGAGMLVAAASPYFDRVYAADLDTSITTRTVNALNLQNVTVVSDFNYINDKFDVAVLWHTLEHIYDPVEFLLKIKGKLSPDGVIYCQVPMYRKEYFVDTHIWFFNPLTVDYLKNACGFGHAIISFDPHNSYLTFCLCHPKF